MINKVLNQRVQAVIDNIIKSGAEAGLQVAAYINGKLAVDAWSGVSDVRSSKRVDGDTLFTAFSTTKGFTVTCLHILADKGQVDYDTPIACYWPEFAANGKGSITIRQALTHTAGIPQLPSNVTPQMMSDWDAMCQEIVGMTPLWGPGTKTGYHAWSFGWIIGEVIHRVSRKPMDIFWKEDLCKPLGIKDAYLGIPDDVEHRVASIKMGSVSTNMFVPSSLYLKAIPPQVTSARVANQPGFRRGVIPAGGGIMNARSIARLYAMLANGGALDGVRILSRECIDNARAVQVYEKDEVLGDKLHKGLGYMVGGHENGDADGSDNEFGHSGFGGTAGFADPVRNFSLGLTKTLVRTDVEHGETAAHKVADVIRDFIDKKLR